jgi:hypothetical protein
VTLFEIPVHGVTVTVMYNNATVHHTVQHYHDVLLAFVYYSNYCNARTSLLSMHPCINQHGLSLSLSLWKERTENNHDKK